MLRAFALLFAVLLVLGAPGPLLYAVDYFVIDNDAPTGGDGSAGDPFGTITEALNNASLTRADRILIGPGLYTSIEETYPLVIPNGVEVVGAGQALTTVNAVGGAGPAFQFSGMGQAGVLELLTVTANPAQPLVELIGTDVVFLANSVVFSGGATGILASGITGLTGVNVLVENCSFLDQDNNGVLVDLGLSGTGALEVRSNVFAASDPSLNGVDFRIAGSSNGIARWGAIVSENVFSGTFSAPIDIRPVAETLVRASFDIDVNNNVILGGNLRGLNMLHVQNSSAEVLIDFLASCNVIRNCGDGILLAQVGGIGELEYNMQLIGNSIVSNANTGIEISHAFVDGRFTVNVSGAFNCIADNGQHGIKTDFNLSGSASLFGVMPFRGNLITRNQRDGVRFESSIVGNQVGVGYEVDFGGDAFDQGNNSILGNDVANTGNFEFNASISASGTTFLAQGNWWGTSGLTAVEALVRHNPDTGTLPTVDFANPLASSMAIAPVGRALAGQVLSINSSDGGFVRVAGKKLISATLDGVPLGPLSVSPDGEIFRFTVPFLFPTQAVLVVTNPGGQSGTVVLVIENEEDTGGGCFVATAAFGDDKAPEVRVLREWRDQHLATNAIGRWLVSTYYDVSPALAGAIAERPWARSVSRAALAPVVGAARLWMEAPWALFGLGLGAGWLLLKRRRN